MEELAATLKLIKSKIKQLSQEYIIEPTYIAWTGSRLKSREQDEARKTAKENYLYTASYISYPRDTEIVSIVILREEKRAEIVNIFNKKVIKIGGEGRTAKLATEDSNTYSNLFKLLTRKEHRYAILVSPMPLKRDNRANIQFIGNYTIIGYGFSISKKRRKPIDTAILEGSILRVNSHTAEIDEVLSYGLYSLVDVDDRYYKHVGRLGYASFIPLG